MEEISKLTNGGSSRRKQIAPRSRLIQPVPSQSQCEEATPDDQRSITTDEDEGNEQNRQDSTTTNLLLLPDRKRPYNVSVDPARYRRVPDPENPDAVKFACSLCGNLYKWRKSLNKHWKEKHLEENPPPLDAPVAIRQSKTTAKPSEMLPKPTHPLPHPAFPLHPYAWLNFAQQLFPSVTNDVSSNVPLDLTMKKTRRLSETEVSSTSKKFHRESQSSSEDQCDSSNLIDDVSTFPNGQKLFFCSICSERCLSIETINTHFIDHHLPEFHRHISMKTLNVVEQNERSNFSDPQNRLKCFHCDFVARWPTELQKHSASHSTLRPFKCLICSLTYKWRWDLAKHWDRAHAFARKDRPLINPYKKRDRSMIDEDQSRSPSTIVEIEQKKEERQYSCRWCDYRGRWRSELIQHMRCHHAREKPYRCSNCSYASSWKWDVQKHLKKQHSNNNEVKIVELSDEYLFGSEEKTLTKKRIHHCRQCPFTSNSIGEYRRHLIVHSSERPYRCFHCSYQSKWKCQVKNHMKEENHSGAILVGRKVMKIDTDDDDDDDDNEEEEEIDRLDEISECLSNDVEEGEETDSVRHGTEHETNESEMILFAKILFSFFLVVFVMKAQQTLGFPVDERNLKMLLAEAMKINNCSRLMAHRAPIPLRFRRALAKKPYGCLI